MIKFLAITVIMVTLYIVLVYGFFTEIKPKIDSAAQAYAEAILEGIK